MIVYTSQITHREGVPVFATLRKTKLKESFQFMSSRKNIRTGQKLCSCIENWGVEYWCGGNTVPVFATFSMHIPKFVTNVDFLWEVANSGTP